jgi:hypothetical protein
MRIYNVLAGKTDDAGRRIGNPNMIVEVKNDHLTVHLEGELVDWFVGDSEFASMNTGAFRKNLTEALAFACGSWANHRYGVAFRSNGREVREE